MAALERGISTQEALQTPRPPIPQEPPIQDGVEEWHTKYSSPLPLSYLVYLRDLPAEWERQEQLAIQNNPAYIARVEERERSKAGVLKRFSEAPPEIQKAPPEVPIEVRNFRFWQKRLWLNEKFRKATKGKGFMDDNFSVEFTHGQEVFTVQYARNEMLESMRIETKRVVSESELKEIREFYGEREINGNDLMGGLNRKKLDIKIKSAVERLQIGLEISPDERHTTTYFETERLINKDGVVSPDLSYTPKATFITDEQGKSYVGWLAIPMLQ